MSRATNRALQCIKLINALEIRNRIILKFYPGLLQKQQKEPQFNLRDGSGVPSDLPVTDLNEEISYDIYYPSLPNSGSLSDDQSMDHSLDNLSQQSSTVSPQNELSETRTGTE